MLALLSAVRLDLLVPFPGRLVGFVAVLGQSGNGGVIIQAIVALGRALGLSITVEGVETEQQRVLLRLAGCDEMQGFLFARPAPPKAIDRLIAGSKPGGRAALTA